MSWSLCRKPLTTSAVDAREVDLFTVTEAPLGLRLPLMLALIAAVLGMLPGTAGLAVPKGIFGAVEWAACGVA